MNTQTFPRSPPARPFAPAADGASNDARERAHPVQKRVAGSPCPEAAYGCVEWFMYERIEGPR